MLLSIIRKLLILCVLMACFNVHAATKKDSTCHRVIPTHDFFGEMLSRYVRAGKVDYTGWHKSERDRAALNAYVKSVAGYCLGDLRQLKKSVQLALLLNLYNAAVIELVLRSFPLQSINDIRAGSTGAFDITWIDTDWVKVKKISLNHLENKLIRPWFKDPRIHFALVCAAKSCPGLLNEPYQPAMVFKQLEEQTRLFFQDRQQVAFSSDEKVLLVSKVFTWYEADFVAESGSLRAYLQREFKKATGTVIPSKVDIRFYDYSWALNRAP